MHRIPGNQLQVRAGRRTWLIRGGAAAFVLGIAIWFVGGSGPVRSVSTSVSPKAEPDPPIAESVVNTHQPVTQAANRRKIETEVITLGPRGFEPSEITRPHSDFFLMVENNTGQEEIKLQLDREAGNRLSETRVPRGKRDWADRFELPPGNYVLSEANHPSWKCTITITPK